MAKMVWFILLVLLAVACIYLNWRLEPAATRIQTAVSLTLQAATVLELLIIVSIL